MEELKKYRNELDKLDKNLIDIIGKRFEINKNIIEFKKKNNITIFDESREKELIENRKQYAKEKGVSIEFTEKIINEILTFAKKF